jgi:hypothetical protein
MEPEMKTNLREYAFRAFTALVGFAGIVVLILDLMIWRPN